MSDLGNLLIRGSEKVIDRLLLVAPRTRRSATLSKQIEREPKLLDELRGAVPGGIAA
jgi:hypothetical protein